MQKISFDQIFAETLLAMTRLERRREMSDLVSAYEKSGMSQKAFCANAGIKLPTFNYWRRKLSDQNTADQVGLDGFIELSVTRKCLFDIELPSGLVLRTRDGVDFEEFYSCLLKLEATRA